MSYQKPILINENKLKSILDNKIKFVMIEVFDPNNGVNIIMDPVIKKTFKTCSQQFNHYRINISQSPILCNTYRIYSVPQYLIFYKGQILKQVKGMIPLSEMINHFNEAIKCAETI